MRHRKKTNHLSRTSSHRKSMLANMASSLILHKRINTTLAKAKALRKYVEPLITKSKEDSTHSRRTVFSYLQNKEAVAELFRDVAKKIASRPGGYTRILKTGTRLGDNAEMALIELVDYNENLLAEKGDLKGDATRRRRRRGAASKKEDIPVSKEQRAKVTAGEMEIDETEIVEDVVAEEQAEEIIDEVVEKAEPETAEPHDTEIVEDVAVKDLPGQVEAVAEEVEAVTEEETVSGEKEEKETGAEEQKESDDTQEDTEGEDKEVK